MAIQKPKLDNVTQLTLCYNRGNFEGPTHKKEYNPTVGLRDQTANAVAQVHTTPSCLTGANALGTRLRRTCRGTQASNDRIPVIGLPYHKPYLLPNSKVNHSQFQ